MLEVLYEDNHVICAVKPQNVPSQADSSRDADMLSLVKEYVAQKYGKPGAVYIGLIHRLDRPAGGAMAFARTSKAAARLCAQMRSGRFLKEYLAVLSSPPCANEGELSGYIVKDAKTNISRLTGPDFPGAKPCSLTYSLAGSSGGLALVRIRLNTGRPHQIRVQMAGAGCPLYGDAKYGRGGDNLALWSCRLSFEHPTRKIPVEAVSLPPVRYPWTLFDVRP